MIEFVALSSLVLFLSVHLSTNSAIVRVKSDEGEGCLPVFFVLDGLANVLDLHVEHALDRVFLAHHDAYLLSVILHFCKHLSQVILIVNLIYLK